MLLSSFNHTEFISKFIGKIRATRVHMCLFLKARERDEDNPKELREFQ